MKSVRLLLLAQALPLLLSACAETRSPLEDFEALDPVTILEYPSASGQPGFPPEQVAHGKYMVTLLGCGSCHTQGALVGQPDPERLLAGSDIGIAYSDPLVERNPGVVYPANLTPDPQTGIGSWSVEQIVQMLRRGIDRHGSQTLPVMPWPAYSELLEEDARAIAAYLKSLQAVRHVIPPNVPPGQRAPSSFVHFGVYRSQ